MKLIYLQLILIVCFTHNIMVALEKRRPLSAPTLLLKKFETKENQMATDRLLCLAQTLTKNPFFYLPSVETFYEQSCQTKENRSLIGFMRTPCLNLQKIFAYMSVARTVNQQVYQPHVHAVLEQMSRQIEPQVGNQDNKLHDVQMEYLLNLTDHPVLKKKAQELFASEWAYTSVSIDLAAHVKQLILLKESFESEKQKLSLAEQNDNSLAKLSKKFEQNITLMMRANSLISARKHIKKLNNNTRSYLVKHIHKHDLEKKLNKYKDVVSVEQINTLLKSQNDQGNGLIHVICQDEHLSHEQIEYAIAVLEDYGLHINEHNNNGKTPLDLVGDSQSPIAQVLRRLGAEHSLAKVNSLKKSYDTPPSSPDEKSVIHSKMVTFKQ